MSTPTDVAVSVEDDEVVFVTEEDLQLGTEVALAELQMTYEELEACAKGDEFPSHKARLAWFMIAPRVENC